MAGLNILIRDVGKDVKMNIKSIHLSMQERGDKTNINDLYKILLQKGLESYQKEEQTDKAA